MKLNQRLLGTACGHAPSRFACRAVRWAAHGVTSWLVGCLLFILTLSAGQVAGETVDFNRDVRPILSDNCFHCHGPDPSDRQAELRLDVWDDPELLALSTEITAGEPEESELISRVFAEEDDYRMPPSDTGKSLTTEQKEVLRRWVEQGAHFEKHWAFIPPSRPQLPVVENKAWVSNAIDAFILARLEAEGLQPSPEAAPNTLLRRLSLDLVGLPPTMEEVQQFQGMSEEEAYDRAVDRLLASHHFGERWARVWLDAARYADSDGYEKDLPRNVWMYRDYVIRALNQDMPYDRFIVEQVAGDLLPDATQDQKVATGFLRNSMVNREGGIDPEEFRMEAMYDRMDAIGKSILGLTIQCAQCHSHKYDPLTQTDYYRMFALINNCHEAELTVYTEEDLRKREQILGQIEEVKSELKRNTPDWTQKMAEWEESLPDLESGWTIVRPEEDGSGGQKHYLQEDGSILAQGYTPPQLTSSFHADVDQPTTITAVRLELMNDPNLRRGGPGRSMLGLCALSEFKVEASPPGKWEEKIELKIKSASADVNPEKKMLERREDDGEKPDRYMGPVELAIDGDDLTAWSIDIGPGRSNVPREAVFVLEEPFVSDGPVLLTFTLAQKHGGRPIESPVNYNLGRFRFSITSSDNPQANPIPKSVREILRVPAAARTAAQIDQVFSYWRTTVGAWQEANQRIEALWKQHPVGTSQLVLQQREQPRPSHRLERGDFLSPAEEVEPGVPGFLHSLDEKSPDRLSFARWLVDRRSPTTARALVNRIWQEYFGTGLVATAESFGLQGEAPSHPELLDWLAVELMDNNWSQRHIHRLIVTSSTYQQSSVLTPELFDLDPTNRLLARGPRYRVDAELVRDIALTASGLLNRVIGGPSVYPPAPQFLFEQPASFEQKTWFYSPDAQQYRRALYTFRYRSVPHPAMETFDAPSGTVSCVRRSRSNTPLQALTTLNEPLFLACARSLGRKTLLEGGSTDADRLNYVFLSCLARLPNEEEIVVLQEFLERQRQRFSQPDADPGHLIESENTSPEILEGIASPADQAAWTALARVLLNLDETITKE